MTISAAMSNEAACPDSPWGFNYKSHNAQAYEILAKFGNACIMNLGVICCLVFD